MEEALVFLQKFLKVAEDGADEETMYNACVSLGEMLNLLASIHT